ncbi:MAG: hypothetical protein FJ100_14290 [Deltaproteobacteria bacterium]|nr:hypothetical protein [Deltaproteobacteria bacterium]
MRRWILPIVLAAGCAAPNGSTNPSVGAGAVGQDSSGTFAVDGAVASDVPPDAGAGANGTTAADTGDAKGDTKADAKPDGKADTATPPTDINEIIAPKVICGDSFCADEEDCASCEYDCGPCKTVCGDGKCATGESCATCAKDCGGCAGECGNGYCDPTENCATCAKDCGTCAPGCGNGACDKATETCDDCPLDCGKCSEEPCDPYTSKGCKDFEQCFPYAGGDLVCIGAGKLAKGDKCLPLVDCQKGLVCINSTCAQICDATGKQPQYGCPGGKKCVEIGQPGKLSAGVGACL